MSVPLQGHRRLVPHERVWGSKGNPPSKLRVPGLPQGLQWYLAHKKTPSSTTIQ
jgi:hypothetical protein